MRRKVTLSFEQGVWNEFQIHCIRSNNVPSYLIEAYMERVVKDGKKSDRKGN
jgi:hypothetical protein